MKQPADESPHSHCSDRSLYWLVSRFIFLSIVYFVYIVPLGNRKEASMLAIPLLPTDWKEGQMFDVRQFGFVRNISAWMEPRGSRSQTKAPPPRPLLCIKAVNSLFKKWGQTTCRTLDPCFVASTRPVKESHTALTATRIALNCKQERWFWHLINRDSFRCVRRRVARGEPGFSPKLAETAVSGS